MIIKNIEEIKAKNFPVIILGSGPAGISLALALEKNKIECLIIEAGKDKYDQESQKFYESKIIGDNITNLRHSRLRQFGGTTGHWGGWCKPMDFYNLYNWGIDFKDLNKYSDDTCEILGIKNDFKKAKLDNNFNQIQFQYSKVRFAKKFKVHIEKSKLIHLVKNTYATNLIGANGLASQVNIKHNNKNYQMNSKIFIIGCGGVENSRFLLWSRNLNNNLINNKLPIGKYWMTHPWLLGGIGVLKKDKIKGFIQNKYIDNEGPLHIGTSENFALNNNLLSGSIYMTANEDTKIYKEVIKDLLCLSPKYGKKIARKIFDKDLKCGNVFMNLEEKAYQHNKITLHENIRDEYNIPITKLFYKKSKETLISAKNIMEELAKLVVDKNLGRLAISDNIKNLESYENLGVYHHMGGTRIGNNLKSSVVDRNLKIHETKNLYVIGSSVFPTSGYSNPTFTIIQLSIRLSDKIKKELTI